MRFTTSTPINAAVENTFDWVSNDRLKKLWMEGLVDITYNGTNGSLQEQHFIYKVKEGRTIQEYTGKYLSIEKYSLIAFRLSDSKKVMDMYYQFEPLSEQTTMVHTEIDIEFSDELTKFVGYSMKWFTKRSLLRNIQNLKQCIETGNTYPV
ncbi:SRPBCC family protein [Pseudalkalibacillus caeni]|uniref:SRPBCC family protein n=1 Tax=Exobacillus caeni TaxID=2574798 RepID=UPI00148573EF|nr:SRPBCC family protein [Pseudalkalibacillus caeni]